MSLTPVAVLQKKITDAIAHETLHLSIETVSLLDACGRVLAEDVVSAVNVPANNVSAMDGYALFDVADSGSVWQVVGEAAAGNPFSGSLNAGQCVRIMTGAVVPDAAKTVVMQENVSLDKDSGCLKLLQDEKLGNNIRYQGEEIAFGQMVLQQGHILGQADIMLLASLGVGQVAVFKKLKVAVLSTGDELLQADEPAAQIGQIYDSNRPMLMARLQSLPIEIIDLGCIKDDLPSIQAALQQAALQADVVITSGGVSVGDYDYLRQAVENVGKIHHYKVAMKPGKPFVFGQLNRAWYFGLPGNPISGFVGFDLFVKAALWQLAGAKKVPEPLRFFATLASQVKKNAGRMDIQRVQIWQDEQGQWLAKPMGKQDSHRILGTSQANAYLLLPQDWGNTDAGVQVQVQPFFERFL